jgi:hypothetical protein
VDFSPNICIIYSEENKDLGKGERSESAEPALGGDGL